MAERVCEQCGKAFEAARARFCGAACRVARSRGAKAAVSPRRKRADYRIRDRVRVELRAVGRDATSLGLIALDLAAQLGQPDLPPATRGGLAKELRSTLISALEGTRPRTGVDELKERRNGKRDSARRRASG